MKKNLIVGMLVLGTAAVANAKGRHVPVNDECEDQVRGIVALTANYLPQEGASKDFQDEMKKVRITHVDGEGRSQTVSVVGTDGLKGKIKVYASRGGCFIESVRLSNSN